MSKARDLGNLLDTDGDVNSNSLDNVPTPFFALQHKFQDASFGHFVELTGVANEPTGTRLCGIVISPDGTKLYTPQADRNSPLPDYMRIVQFTLGTPFDLSTITNTVTPANSLDVSGQVNALGAGGPFANSDDSIGGIHFKSDGTKLWMMTGHSLTYSGGTGPTYHSANKIVEYDLSTAWDITSATFNNKWSEALYGIIAAQFTISEDGRFLYHGQSTKLLQWEMTTPFDISTLTVYESYNSEQTYLKSYQCTREHSSSGAPGTVDHIDDIWMSKDGLRWFGLFTHGLSHDAIIYGYTMTTKYDITTSVPIGLVSEHLSRQDPPWQNSLMIGGTNHPNGNVGQQTGMSDEWSSYVQSIFFADDGKKLYVAGYLDRYPNRGAGGIQQYNITDSYKLSIADQGIKIEGEIELASGASVNEISIDTGMSGNSNTAIPTERAVKTYVDTEVGNVPTPDLTPVHQSIATLGLHMGVSANAAAFNLPNAFIDTFEDDSGITTETTVDRNASGEYVASISVEPGNDSYTSLLIQSNTTNGSTTFVDSSSNSHTLTVAGNTQHSTTQTKFGTSTIYFDGTGDYLKAPLNADFQFGTGEFTIDFWFYETSNPGAGLYDNLFHTGSSDGSGIGFIWGLQPAPNNRMQIQMGTGSWEAPNNPYLTGLYQKDTWYHVAVLRTGTTMKVFIDGVEKYSGTRASNYDANHDGFWVGAWGVSPPGGGLMTGYMDEFRVSKGIARWTSGFTPPTKSYGSSITNATGTLISDTQTAPAATTEVSGVILYKDNAGTATLGTHLKIYFTANNGTNWTEAASYGTAQTFSGTTKQVKLGKTTVTSGTQVKLKAVWASQATGSMETQLHGWAVNY